MSEELIPVIAILALFLGLPGIILHYMTQWRRTKGISIEDENLLDDLHETARRLDSRLDSIERIIAADNPGWKDGAIGGTPPADRLSSDRLNDRLNDRLPGDRAEPRLSIRR